MTKSERKVVEATKVDRVREAFDDWMSKYFMAEQHPLTVESHWAAWKEGKRLAKLRKREGR